MRIVKDEEELMSLNKSDTQLRRYWLESVLFITFPVWSIVLLYLGMKHFGVTTVKAASGV